MSFAPVLPLGGYAGWRFLNRTMPAQQAALAATPSARRDEAYFRERIGAVTTAGQLVSDRRLLSVALGAFGLEADVNNRHFLRRVLEDGTLDPAALGNRLADKRYLAFAKAFGFGDFSTPRTQLSTFADEILSVWSARRFEAAVGAQNGDLRLALNARRELPDLAGRTVSETTKWLTILGSEPLRKVFETAFGLPASFAALDIDRQVAVYRDRAERMLGAAGVGQFADPEKVENLLRLFLSRSETRSAVPATAQNSGALTLLRPGTSGSGKILSLLR